MGCRRLDRLMEDRSAFQRSWKGLCGECIACKIVNGVRQGSCLALNDNSFGRIACDDFASVDGSLSGIVQAMLAAFQENQGQQDEEQDV